MDMPAMSSTSAQPLTSTPTTTAKMTMASMPMPTNSSNTCKISVPPLSPPLLPR